MDELASAFKESFELQVMVCQKLLECLLSETDLLRKSEFDTLPEIYELKKQLAESLDEKAQYHQKLLGKLTNQQDTSQYDSLFNSDALSQEVKDELKRKHQELKDLLASCERQNQINGRVIAINRNLNDQLLTIIKGASHTEVYNDKGTIEKGGSSHSSTEV